ncbi:MAG: YdgA family protein [Pasteurellaceae bacterium]|nr:YdgA family protein [Pasteurellaceae bacterium]
MKKSTIATAVVVVLGAVWCGGAWYTGKTIESEYQKFTTQFNEQQKHNHIQIQNVKLQRHFFSSDLSYDLVLTLDDKPLTIPLTGTLYHGPLPLDRLRQFKLTPMMASSEFELVKNDDTQSAFAVAQEENPFHLQTAVSYGRKIDAQATSPMFELTGGDGGKFVWKNMTVKSEFDNLSISDLSLQAENIHYSMDKDVVNNNSISHFTANFNNFSLKGNFTQVSDYNNIYTGSMQMNSDVAYNYQTVTNESFPVKLSGLSVDYNTTVQDKFLNLTLKSEINDVNARNQDLGQLKLDGTLTHIPLAELSKAYPFQDAALFDEFAQALLKAQTELKLDLAYHNPKGKLESKLDVALNKIEGDFKASLNNNASLSFLKQLDFSAKADKSAIYYAIKALANLQSGQEELGEEQITQLVNQSLEAAVKNQLLQDKGNEVLTELHLDKTGNALDLNGKQIPGAAVVFGLFMALSQYSH